MELNRKSVLRIKDLHTSFYTKEGEVKAVNGVDVTLYEKSVLGIVGESGSGKSSTALSVMRLLPYPGQVKEGSIYFQGQDILTLGDESLRKIRGKEIAIIFQEPSTAINPLINIGTHMEEIFLAHSSMAKNEARERSMELLNEYDLPHPAETLKLYPFQLSGGQVQRVMIAMSMAWNPKILIADEITSNLDVTLQADVLDRLKFLRSEKLSSIILITHDMGVIAQASEFVAVMYAGSIVEYSTTMQLFNKPRHPYTSALLKTIPRLDDPERGLHAISGQLPDLIDLPDRCPYIPRCPNATNQCRLEPKPVLREIETGHYVACYNEVE